MAQRIRPDVLAQTSLAGLSAAVLFAKIDKRRGRGHKFLDIPAVARFPKSPFTRNTSGKLTRKQRNTMNVIHNPMDNFLRDHPRNESQQPYPTHNIAAKNLSWRDLANPGLKMMKFSMRLRTGRVCSPVVVRTMCSSRS